MDVRAICWPIKKAVFLLGGKGCMAPPLRCGGLMPPGLVVMAAAAAAAEAATDPGGPVTRGMGEICDGNPCRG